MARPCEENMYCGYEQYDYSEDCYICAIDFDGENCPYIKPWGKRRYQKEQIEGRMRTSELKCSEEVEADFENWLNSIRETGE